MLKCITACTVLLLRWDTQDPRNRIQNIRKLWKKRHCMWHLPDKWMVKHLLAFIDISLSHIGGSFRGEKETWVRHRKSLQTGRDDTTSFWVVPILSLIFKVIIIKVRHLNQELLLKSGHRTQYWKVSSIQSLDYILNTLFFILWPYILLIKLAIDKFSVSTNH